MTSKEAIVAIGPLFKHESVAPYFPDLNLGDQVLDVGGFSGNRFLSRVLPVGVRILSINKYPEPHGRAPDVGGDGRALPFAARSFSLVTAIETLEHVGKPYREVFMEEMVRVTDDTVVILTPIDSPTNVVYEYNLIKRMEEKGLSPKRSTMEHRLLGLPSLSDLVEMGRAMRLPFSIVPSTVASTLFQSMNDQVEVLATKVPMQAKRNIARQIADNAEHILRQAPHPSWEEAYRAIMVFRTNILGTLTVDESLLFQTRNELMAYQAALRQAGWSNVNDEDVYRFYKENPLRGRNIVVEGPEGSGKTKLVEALSERLQEWGYDIAIQTDHGLRQRIREMEKQLNRVIGDPERAEFFAFAMLEASVAGNAYSLLGPCNISINDRGIESVRMHHGLHCPDNVTIPFLLEKGDPPKIPPDLTIVLWVDDPKHNYFLMQREGDLVNKTKKPRHLAFQRNFYQDLVMKGGSQFTGPVVLIQNQGIRNEEENTFEEVVSQALDAIETYCKIPTSR